MQKIVILPCLVTLFLLFLKGERERERDGGQGISVMMMMMMMMMMCLLLHIHEDILSPCFHVYDVLFLVLFLCCRCFMEPVQLVTQPNVLPFILAVADFRSQ
jgi:hypothetical protein